VNRWGTVEEILAHVDEIKHKTVREALRAQADTARLSRRLVELHVDAPVTFEPSRFAYGLGPAQWGARVRDFFRRLEMNTIVRTLDAAAPVARIDRGAYRLVTDLDGVRSVAARARETGTLALDLVTATDDAVAPALCGVALAAAPGEAVYVPFAHRGLQAVPQLRAEDVLAALAPLLGDAAVAKDLPRAKQTLRILEGTHDADAASAAPGAASAAVPAPAPAREPRDLLDLMAPPASAPAPVPAAAGPLALRGLRGDPALLGFLLDTSRDGGDLVALSRKELDHSALALEDVLGKGTRGRAPTPEDLAPADLLPWAGEQVDLALRLTAKLLPAVHADADLRRLYEELELPLCAVLARLERRGVLVDVARLDALAAEFQQRMNVLQEECWTIAGEPFNPGSTPQLRHVLFEKLGLAPGRRTKTGFSTDQSVLEELDHPIAEKLLLLRKLTKLKNTYLDVLPKLVNARTGRVHTTFNQTGAATGRLSSDNPNLQNIPVRDEEGKRIREAFHAAPGWRLVSADYSQIELRLLAHLSADDALLAAFRSGEDIHRATAAEVLGVARDAVTREQRDAAKAVNFGIMYGISSFGLARQLGVGQAEAQRFIDRYRARYGGIQRWIERTLADARRTGEVRTLQGRRRRISNLGARQRPLREGAERQAINTPIQGSAADVMKAAMIAVERALGAELPAARMLLTVHDELLIEAPEADAARAAAVARREMEAVLKLDPPLVVDTGTGRTWLEAH
jgi:DNA polymerase-1